MKWREMSKRSEATLTVRMKHEDDYGMNRDSNLSQSVGDEQRLWDVIPRVPDLQCGWQLLAGSRANHTIRTLPPDFSSEYASEHDEGMWRTAVALLGQLPGTLE